MIAAQPSRTALRAEPGRSETSRVSPFLRAFMAALEARVGAVGEPWRSSFVPATLEAELCGLSFAVTCDVTPALLNARYFAGRADGLRVGGMSHLMWAGAAPHVWGEGQ